MADAEKRAPVAAGFGELLENITAPEWFATTAPILSMVAGVVTLTFASSRFDHSVTPPIRRQVVIGRVVMPAVNAASLATELYNFLANNGVQFTTPTERERPQ